MCRYLHRTLFMLMPFYHIFWTVVHFICYKFNMFIYLIIFNFNSHFYLYLVRKAWRKKVTLRPENVLIIINLFEIKTLWIFKCIKKYIYLSVYLYIYIYIWAICKKSPHLYILFYLFILFTYKFFMFLFFLLFISFCRLFCIYYYYFFYAFLKLFS